MGVLLGEEPAQAFFRDIGGDAVRIYSLARELQSFAVDIGGEDLQRRVLVGGSQFFEKEHRNRISFLACGAGGDPYTNRPVVSAVRTSGTMADRRSSSKASGSRKK